MAGIIDSAEHGEFRAIQSTAPLPAELPEDWDPFARTLA